jgi:hypothetical protein
MRFDLDDDSADTREPQPGVMASIVGNLDDPEARRAD